MKELLEVFVFENLDGKSELSTEIFIHFLHDEQGDFLVIHSADDGVLKHMGEWSVPDVVQEDGGSYGFFF